MDIEQLKTFLEVERMRNFRKAAENLCISPSAISARIRQLEQTLGLALFRRDRQKVSLSPAGERFKRHARFILGAWERAHEEIALSDQVDKRLTVAGVRSRYTAISFQESRRFSVSLQADGIGGWLLESDINQKLPEFRV